MLAIDPGVRPEMASAAVGRGSAVTRLDLRDFRNYVRLRLALDGRSVVLTGLNGAGKTNLLEALSLLAPGRGLRRARIAELARRDGADASPCAWAVAARLTGPAGEVAVGIGRMVSDGEGDRRELRIDGAPARGQAALADACSVVWLTPEMDRLFADGSSVRRRFLDRLVFGTDPTHATRVTSYEHPVRERARALRNGVTDDDWLCALEDTISAKGIEIALARQRTIDRLNHADAAPVASFPHLRLTMTGALDHWLAEASPEGAGTRLRAALRASRARDREAGGAQHGAHRSDFRARNLDTAMAADQCSTGEQKAMLVGLILAHARLLGEQAGATPIVLLDEVAAHLDERRRTALYTALGDFGAQAWMTGTDRALFAGMSGRAQFFDVADGAVTAAEID